MNQKRKYKPGDMVVLLDSAFDVLPRLNRAEMRLCLEPMRIIDVADVPIDGLPFHQDLSLEGIEQYFVSSEDVTHHE